MNSPGFFLVRHIPKRRSDCLECYPVNVARILSPVTFLIALLTNLEVAHDSKCPFNKRSGCVELEIMPDFMCEFELGRVKVDFDLNLPSNEENSRSPITNLRKRKPVQVAKVVLFMWHIQEPENTEGVAELHECFLCLTRKCKVVLISVIKRYLWMVVSNQAKQISNCDQCVGKLMERAEFAYNQFLRQVPALDVNVFFATDGSKKRKRTQKSYQAGGK
uniref:AlNc14C405G11411 protein n=1 Tax=Albugo laibachii Nc14 TaxID=890382 RepID=F0WZ01_9STRA|nr:AlNc14C405G11411 [Albugo laibachii Nc14]|eukprot:CCA26715.1 AlNc14C405G11411 [Albugo laibachii Nc14]